MPIDFTIFFTADAAVNYYRYAIEQAASSIDAASASCLPAHAFDGVVVTRHAMRIDEELRRFKNKESSIHYLFIDEQERRRCERKTLRRSASRCAEEFIRRSAPRAAMRVVRLH